MRMRLLYFLEKRMVICEKCGAIIREDDLIHRKYKLSDYRGGIYENDCRCSCGGDVNEAKQCKACGEYFNADDMHGEYCEDCLTSEMTVDNAIKCGAEVDARREVSLNGFLASLFSEEEIDALLLREMERRMAKSRRNTMTAINRAEWFCKEDESWFADWVERRSKI